VSGFGRLLPDGSAGRSRPEANVHLTALAYNVRGRLPSKSIGGATERDRRFHRSERCLGGAIPADPPLISR